MTAAKKSKINVKKKKRGTKRYELSNHLNNVSSTVSDRKLSDAQGGTVIVFFLADVSSMQDYYPFGMIQIDRQMQRGLYLYGFNGMRKDNELAGIDNMYMTRFRILDPRLGRWWSLDPVVHHDASPYVSFDNSPIFYADPSGSDSEEGDGGDAEFTLDTRSDPGLMGDRFKADTKQSKTHGSPEKGNREKVRTYTDAGDDRKFTMNVRLGRATGSEFDNTVGIKQIYGGPKVDYYSNNYYNPNSTRTDGPIFIDEPNNFGNVTLGFKFLPKNYSFSILYMKQKYGEFDDGFQFEASSSIEMGLDYKKALYKTKDITMSLNVALTGGLLSARTMRNGADEAMFPARKFLFGQSLVGYSGTLLVGVDYTFLQHYTIFVAGAFHHAQYNKQETGADTQGGFGLGSVSIISGIGFEF